MRIAITGGIGSGKSSFAEYIREYGYPVFSCDEIYRSMQKDGEYLEKIMSEFGDNAVKDGSLNREFISSEVFSDSGKLKKLNSIAHPEIMKRLFNETDKYALSFAEVPLLFEGGFENAFDRVVIVYRNIEERIRSVVERDSTDREKVINRIKSQTDYESKLGGGYDIIFNNGTTSDLKKKAIDYLDSLNQKK